jgi:hypothetical protein
MAGNGSGTARISAELVGLSMPDDFPTPLYNQTWTRLSEWRAANPVPNIQSWQEDEIAHFAAAWQGVAYRFLDADNHDREYTASVNRAGMPAGDPWERYVQDRELDGFFYAGQAVLENLYYGIYALGSALDASVFDAIKNDQLQAITVLSTEKALERTFHTDHLTQVASALAAAEKDQNHVWFEWRRVRNTFPHRMAPGHHIHVQIGGTGPAETVYSWAESIELNELTTSRRRQWLQEILTITMDAVAEFVQQHFA